MKTLDPLILKEKYYTNVEREINRILDEILFVPLALSLGMNKKELRNAKDSLTESIRNGDVYFENGVFKGSFNSRITKRLKDIGATYNKKIKGWTYDGALPPDISIANAQADARFKQLRKDFIQTLDDVDIESISRISQIPDAYDQTITWMNDDFLKTAKAITVDIQMTDAMRGIITAEWSQNLDLYVKGWAQESIFKMRDQVEKHVFAGGRANGLENILMQRYGVSRHKAKFLARQETGLLMAKFHESRCNDIGITDYIWSSSMDERTRDDHRDLNGKRFSFSAPPIADKRTGTRANPSEYFGCRCTARPIVD